VSPGLLRIGISGAWVIILFYPGLYNPGQHQLGSAQFGNAILNPLNSGTGGEGYDMHKVYIR
jgi:hypothetical protein